jgi:hypothetical protein
MHSLKTGIDCAWLPRAAVRARQTRSFFYALITVFVSSIEARQPRAAVDRRHKNASTERAQHTEIPLPRDKEPLRFGSTRAKFARGNMVSTLRGKTTNIVSRGSLAHSIPDFRHFCVRLRTSNFMHVCSYAYMHACVETLVYSYYFFLESVTVKTGVEYFSFVCRKLGLRHRSTCANTQGYKPNSAACLTRSTYENKLLVVLTQAYSIRYAKWLYSKLKYTPVCLSALRGEK